MSWFNEDVGPADVLRAAARLACIDGWDPGAGIQQAKEPSSTGRFYTPSTTLGTVIRAYRLLRSSWMNMIRACEALQRAVGSKDDSGVRAWERAPGRTGEQIERMLLRAAHRCEQRVAA